MWVGIGKVTGTLYLLPDDWQERDPSENVCYSLLRNNARGVFMTAIGDLKDIVKLNILHLLNPTKTHTCSGIRMYNDINFKFHRRAIMDFLEEELATCK